MKTLRFEGIYTLLSPLCHTTPEIKGEENTEEKKKKGEGTVTRLRVIPIIDDNNEIAKGYGVSGAEVRSIMKMLLVNYTLEKLGITSKDLPPEVAIMLYCGGIAEPGDSIPEYEIKEKYMKEVPLIGLFGGVVNGCFFSSTLCCDFAYMLTKQSFNLYQSLLVERGIISDSLKDSEDFQPEKYRYGHARHRKSEVAHLDNNSSNSIQMPYHIEAIPAGSRLVHGFTLIEPSEGDMACFEAGVRLLLDYGFLGGKSAAGYGRFTAEYFKYPGYKEPLNPTTEKYDNWLAINGDTMKNDLLELPQVIKSKASAQAPKACEWLVDHKEEIGRLIDGTECDEDNKTLFGSTYIGDREKLNKVIKAHKTTVTKALSIDCGREELFGLLDDSQSKELAKFQNEITKAAKKKKSSTKKKQGAA